MPPQASLNDSPEAPGLRAPLITFINATVYARACKLEGSAQFSLQLHQEPDGKLRTSSIGDTPDLSTVPEVYHNFADVFSKANVSSLPPHRNFDLKIELEEGASPPPRRLYLLSLFELDALRKFIDENLSTSFIRPTLWSFLAEMTSLEKLEVRGTQLEPLVSALSLQDDNTGTVIGIGPGIVGVAVGGGMGRGIGIGPGGGGVGAGAGNLVCLRLKSLVARESQGYPDGIAKLVQMVEACNPDILPVGAGSGVGVGVGAGGGDGAVPSRLCKLEVWDCVPLGADVIDWLKKRVKDVVVVDPPYSK